MAYKFSFADNEIYSADDVNKITKRLVTSGIEDSFEDGVAYNVSKFNEAGKLVYTSGVVPETCLTLKVVSAGDGAIVINPGMAFFNDGSVIEVEDGGENMQYVAGAVNYVYLKNDLEAFGISYPCCSTEEPEGDYVMLAEIDESGSITDKRTYARGKLPGYQSSLDSVLHFHETMELTLDGEHYAAGDASFDIGANKFEYILAADFAESTSVRAVLALYRITDGKIISFHALNDGEAVYDDGQMYIHFDSDKRRRYLTLSFADGVLNVHAVAFAPLGTGSMGKPGDKITISLDLVFI